MRIVFLGPPGAGKGTQAKLLAKEQGLLHLSTGDILRDAVARGTDTGLEAKAYMDQGKLAPDGIVDRIVEERLGQGDAQAGYILDGYPRNLHQGQALDGMLERLDTPLDAVLLITVDDDVLVQRILARGQGRADDREDVVRERLEVYRNETEPLVGFYRGKSLLLEIDGDRSIEDVANAVRVAAGGAA